MTVRIYASGLCHCSVCVPKDMTKEEVAIAVNNKHPTGIQSQWVVSSEDTFIDGTPNGVECICDGEITRHWLMVC